MISVDSLDLLATMLHVALIKDNCLDTISSGVDFRSYRLVHYGGQFCGDLQRSINTMKVNVNE